MNDNLGPNPYIETISGKKVHFLNPDPDSLDIVDIAASLGNQCRYTGHCKFYSVAEHSILVASMVPQHHALTALMHDASEAYLTDVATPVKNVLGGRYREIEDILMTALAKKFGFSWPLPDVVKWADKRALLMEAKQLMVSKGENWREANGEIDIPDIKLRHLLPPYSASAFLSVYTSVANATAILVPDKRIITNVA